MLKYKLQVGVRRGGGMADARALRAFALQGVEVRLLSPTQNLLDSGLEVVYYENSN